MVPNPTLPYGGYDVPEMYEHPEPTGKVFIVMKSNITGKSHTYIKQHKTDDKWLEYYDFEDFDFDRCWAFSKQGAKKIIERLKTRTYKDNYDKGLIEFETWEEYSY